MRPKGLPHLDIHGFARAAEGGYFYAALAGDGLYRSIDGGKSFRQISDEVGGNVYGLALEKDGVLYAADPARGVLVNGAGDGNEWRSSLKMPAASLASNELEAPRDRLLAGGRTLQLFDGRRWSEVLAPDDPVGPVAFAPGDSQVAYAVAYDRKLYRSDDGGETWREVR